MIKEQYRANTVGHWDFRLGTISDQSDNGNDGTFASTPIAGHGSKGRRFNFDGTDDYIDLDTHIANFSSLAEGTVIVTFKNENSGTQSQFFSSSDATDASSDFSLTKRNVDSPAIVVREGGAATLLWLGTDSVVDEQVHQFAYTSDSAGNYMAFDGNAAAGAYTTGTSSTQAFFADVNDLDILRIAGRENNGGVLDFFDGDIYEVIVFNNRLTAAELSQYYTESLQEAQLNAIPKKTSLSEGDFSDSGLIAGWDMANRGGTILDCTGNGNDATMIGNLFQVNGVNGKALDMDGSNAYLTVADDVTLQTPFASGGAIETMFMARSDGESNLGRILQKLGLYLYCSDEAAGFIKMTFRKGFTTTDGVWITTNAVIPLNTPVHLLISYDSDSVDEDPTFYVNGVSVGAVGAGLTESQTPVGTSEAETGAMYIGNYSSLDGNWDGWIDTLKFHNTTFTASQVIQQYEKAKGKLNYYANGKDWNESVQNETAAFLSNTDWTIQSGTWQVDDTGNLDGTKQITSIATGTLYTNSAQAYGTWEFEMYPVTGGNINRFYFIASDATGYLTTTAGYFFQVIGTNQVQVYEANGAGNAALKHTSVETFSFSEWHKFKVTRNGGVFNVYYDLNGVWTLSTEDAAGANPFTDTTFTSSNYVFFENSTGNNFRNLKFSPIIQ